MKELRLASTLVRVLTKDSIHYPGRLITNTLSIFARCGILLILYWYVFRLNDGLINNTPFVIVAWSMFFYFSFSILYLRNIAKLIMQDIRSGTIEVLLSKPISYLRYRMWWEIGLGLYSFVVVSVFGSIVLALIVGIPQTMKVWIFIPSLLLIFVGASVLSLVLYGIVGLLAFWIEDINPIFWIVDKAVMILGGSYLPVALFPPLMYKIALYSPFGASQFMTHTVYESWKSDWIMLLGIQFVWICVLGLVMVLLFKKAKARVFVNGG